MSTTSRTVLRDAAVLQEGATLPEYTAQQYWIAIAGIVVLLLAILWGRYRSTYAGLGEQAAAHKAALLREKAATTPVSTRLPATDDLVPHRDAIDQLTAAALAESPREAHDAATLRGSIAEIRAAVGAALADRFASVSRLAVLVGETGLAMLVFGSVAVSTGAVVSLLQSGAPAPGLGDIVGSGVDLTVGVLETGVDLLLAFPFVDVVFVLLLGYGLLFASWAYANWQLWAAFLLAAAAAIAVLDHRLTTDIDVHPRPDRVETSSAVFGSLLSVWLAGVLPAALGQLVGLGVAGSVIGFLLALGLAVYLLGRGLYGAWQRIKRTARRYGDRQGRRTVAIYLVVRRLAASVAAGVAPLAPIYVVVIVATGRGTRVLWAAITAPFETQVVIGLVLLAAIALVAWVARTSQADLRGALVEALARRTVRVGLVARGLPIGLAAIATVALYSFFGYVFSPGWALAYSVFGGALVGLLGRGIYVAFLRTRRRMSLFQREDTPSSLVVEAFTLPDDDGTEHLFVRFNGATTLAWLADEFDADALDTVVEVGEGLAVDGEADPTFAEWRARDLLELGTVDPAETRTRLERKIQKDVIHDTLRDEFSVEAAEFEDAMADYPDEICSDKVTQWLRHNVIKRRGDAVVLEQDPHELDRGA